MTISLEFVGSSKGLTWLAQYDGYTTSAPLVDALKLVKLRYGGKKVFIAKSSSGDSATDALLEFIPPPPPPPAQNDGDKGSDGGESEGEN